jgi:hypothetical protein
MGVFSVNEELDVQRSAAAERLRGVGVVEDLLEGFLHLQRPLDFRHPGIRKYSDVPGRRHLRVRAIA